MSRHPAAIFLNKWTRKTHRWGALAVALPLAVVIGSGLLLQLKKHVAWIQPPEQPGAAREPSVSFESILAALRAVPEAAVRTWDDVERLDVRPSRGLLKVRCRNSWEVQVDAATGEVLQVAYRRSDLIESIHDGSFFDDRAKLWVFFPTGVVLLGVWCTGVYLWWLPIGAKRRGRCRRAAAA